MMPWLGTPAARARWATAEVRHALGAIPGGERAQVLQELLADPTLAAADPIAPEARVAPLVARLEQLLAEASAEKDIEAQEALQAALLVARLGSPAALLGLAALFGTAQLTLMGVPFYSQVLRAARALTEAVRDAAPATLRAASVDELGRCLADEVVLRRRAEREREEEVALRRRAEQDRDRLLQAPTDAGVANPLEAPA